MKTIPPYNDDDRELEEDIRTFEKSRDIDDDRAASTRVPRPRKPNPHDAAIALPEPDEDEGNSERQAPPAVPRLTRRTTARAEFPAKKSARYQLGTPSLP